MSTPDVSKMVSEEETTVEEDGAALDDVMDKAKGRSSTGDDDSKKLSPRDRMNR